MAATLGRERSMSVKVKEADWGAVASTAATGVLLERRSAIGGENASSA